MKTNYYPLLIAFLAFSILVNIFLYKDTLDQLSLNQEKTFIWKGNTIPKDGSPILLEYTVGNKVYLNLMESYDSPEYQFTITDDSISVQDLDRYVGTVKVEGQLKQLIDQDNE